MSRTVEEMRKVAYCAAGTVVAFPIPQAFYDRHVASHPDASLADVGAPCTVLERVVAAAREGAVPRSGESELAAACSLWRFFNESGGYSDDIIVIDHVGDCRSLEFSPLSDTACGLPSDTCPNLQGALVAEPLPG